jgi:flagellar motor switch protein FliM
MHLAFPTVVLEPIIHIFDQEWHSRKKIIHDGTMLQQLRNVPVDVSIETGETQFPMQSLLSLRVGDTLVLDQRQEWPVQLKVAGRNKLQAAPNADSAKRSFIVTGQVQPVREETIYGNVT